MSAREELEKLQAMRAELEAESRLLKEKQSNLENNVLSLEEKIAIEELRKEKAVIEELKNRNKAAKDAIAELEAKKKKLENKLEQKAETPEAPSKKGKAKKEPKPADEAPEEAEGGVTVTAIEGEAVVESPEASAEDSKKPEKKKRRFF
jgi:chromosome segregation ATPase